MVINVYCVLLCFVTSSLSLFVALLTLMQTRNSVVRFYIFIRYIVCSNLHKTPFFSSALSFYYNSVFDGCWSYFYGLFILYSFIYICINRSMWWCTQRTSTNVLFCPRPWTVSIHQKFPMNFRFSPADRSFARIIFPFSNGIFTAFFHQLFLFSYSKNRG